MLIDFVVASKVDKYVEENVTHVRYKVHRKVVCESTSLSAVLMCWGFDRTRSGKVRLL